MLAVNTAAIATVVRQAKEGLDRLPGSLETAESRLWRTTSNTPGTSRTVLVSENSA